MEMVKQTRAREGVLDVSMGPLMPSPHPVALLCAYLYINII